MDNIKNYEAMAKLNLPENERKWVSKRADMLIESFAALEKIDTSEIKPLVSVLNIQNVLREDICIKTVSRSVLLENAPEQYEGYFKVPKTLE